MIIYWTENDRSTMVFPMVFLIPYPSITRPVSILVTTQRAITCTKDVLKSRLQGVQNVNSEDVQTKN